MIRRCETADAILNRKEKFSALNMSRFFGIFSLVRAFWGALVLAAVGASAGTALQTILPQDGISVVEGVVRARSVLPDPKKSDYPDCRYTLEFEGNAILSGAACPQKVQLIAEGFRNYAVLPSGRLQVGDKLRCQVIPFEKLPPYRKTTQQADDLSLFELESFYLLEYEKIAAFADDPAVDFTDADQNYVSVFERRINPPLTKQEKQLQAEAIRADLKRINTLLEGWDRAKIAKIEAEFQAAWKRETAKDKPGWNRVGTYVWRNIDNSFWCLPEKYQLLLYYSPVRKENIAALVALREFLEAHGCQLIVNLIPDSHAIAARVINPEFRDVPEFWSAFTVRELLENNIEAIYDSEALLRNYNRHPLAFFYPGNLHPGENAQDVATELVAERLRRYSFPAPLAPERFSEKMIPHVYGKNPAYLYPANCDIGENKVGSEYLCRRILYDGKRLLSDSRSPVWVIGNSFLWSPAGDSFHGYLCRYLKMPLTVTYVSGFGPMTAVIQQLFRHPEEYLKGKKAVVMNVGSSHLHANFSFSDIRRMDQDKRLLSGKTTICTIPVSGNTEVVPKFGKDLRQAHFFTIPAENQCMVAECTVPKEGIGKNAVLVIPVCASAPSWAKLRVNGREVPMQECSEQYRWCRTLVPLSSSTTQIKVELTGRPGSSVAIGDLKICR